MVHLPDWVAADEQCSLYTLQAERVTGGARSANDSEWCGCQVAGSREVLVRVGDACARAVLVKFMCLETQQILGRPSGLLVAVIHMVRRGPRPGSHAHARPVALRLWP